MSRAWTPLISSRGTRGLWWSTLPVLMTFSGPFNLRWFWGCSSLNQQLRESALWNAWKVITAGVLPTRNGGQKGLHDREPDRAPLSFRITPKTHIIDHCSCHSSPSIWLQASSSQIQKINMISNMIHNIHMIKTNNGQRSPLYLE